MAYHYSSPRSCSWYTNDGAATASSKITCIFNKSSSLLFHSSRIESTPVKQRCLIVLSLHQTSPSSDSSISSSGSSSSSSGCFKVKKSLDRELLSVDGSFSLLEEEDESNWKDKNWVSRIGADHKKNEEERRKGKKKQPLWRRMLFVSNKVKSIILLNAITIVYASDISVVKEVEAVMDPAAFSAVRFIMSAIPFLPFVYRARDDVKIRNAGMELGLWVSLGYLVEALALLTSDAGRASFISLFTVIVVPLLDGMLGTIIPARTWFGVFMSVVGVGMLECSGSPPNVGDLLNFISAIFFGIHMLRTEHISRDTKKENFLALLGYEVSVVALLSTIWYLIGVWFDGIQDLEQFAWIWTWDSIVAFPWIPALYTGIFSTGLCLWVEIAAMRDVSATETAIIYGLEPVWGAGFAWFLLGERWGTMGWIGAALVLGGSLIIQILGSSPSNEDLSSKESNKSIGMLSIGDKKHRNNSLSASPIVVRSSEEDIKRIAK